METQNTLFTNGKKKQLSKEDKSNIGEWDEKISDLCNKINKKTNYYTTSSCSGRIVLLKESEVKQPGAFLFRTHNKVTFQKLKTALEKIKYDGLVEFQMTSCIMHIACLTLEDAQDLVTKAKLAGWKKSGIMGTGKRFMVELHSTENMSFPIMNNKVVLVDDNFLKLAIEIANNKLDRVWKKIDKLKEMI
jgi:tRNA wybutosine-synthesizing protein 3